MNSLSTVAPEVRSAMRKQYLLIVDNSETISSALCSSAAMLGIRDTKTYADGYSALESFLGGRQPTIIFVNGNGTSYDPIALCKCLRDRKAFPNPYLPLIMVSSNVTRQEVLKARDAGVDEFLACPFSPQSVYERIYSVLNDRRGFVSVKGYFGPDRRRGAMARWLGADRRGAPTELIEPYTGRVYLG